MRGETQETSKNPTNRYFEWNSTNKTFKYWNAEKKENVLVKLPFTFLVLDQKNTVGGFSEKENTGIYANEVVDMATEEMTVFAGKTKLMSGIYGEMKDAIKSAGGKFCKNVYISYKDGKEYKIGVIKMMGSAIGPWFDFTTDNNAESGAITVATTTAEKKGSNKYNSPVFTAVIASNDAEEAAIGLASELGSYFASKTPVKAEEKVAEGADMAPNATEEDSLPF